jgi:hypothetical protein
MTTAETVPKRAENEVSPHELHSRIMRVEKQLSENAFKWLQKQFANERFFRYPLFDSPHHLSDEARKLLSDAGIKYKFLLQLLRNCQTRGQRLLIIATWLYQEGICQPEDVHGSDFSDYRRNALRGDKGRISLTDVRYAFIVDYWVPYFEWLLRARRQRRGLEEFDELAIQSASGKRSAVAAACEYVAPRLGRRVASLANAHSRVIPKSRKQAAAQQLARQVS